MKAAKEKKLTQKQRADIAAAMKYQLCMGCGTIEKAAQILNLDRTLAEQIAAEYQLMAWKY